MKAISRALGRFLECLANRTNGFDLKDRCVGYDKLDDASAGSFVEIYDSDPRQGKVRELSPNRVD